MPDVFLSYSREDQATARQFAEGLQHEGFSVWWDQALTIGEAFDKITEQALDESRAVVVLWSKNSVDSRWVRAEATQAHTAGRLAPIMIESCRRPIMFELTQTPDLSGWNGDRNDQRWRSFVAGLRRFLGDSVTAVPTPPSAASNPAPGSSRWTRIALATALGALILGGLAWRALTQPNADSAAKAAAYSPSAPASSELTGPVTLAVLPFENLSGDAKQDYFSDGLTEEILNQLAQIKGLRVTGRTSSFSFKGKHEDLRDIARKLGVENLLEGSVRKDGDELRITAQLIDGRDGSHRWSRSYDQKLSSVFDLQDQVARDVSLALSVTLDAGDIRRAQGGTTNVAAWEHFLEGRQESLGSATAGFSNRAARHYREAVRLDPNFAMAWAALGSALNSIAALAEPPLPADQTESLRKESRAAIERARLLAPDTWWARSPMVTELVAQRKWAEAERLARSILDEQPLTSADVARAAPFLSILQAVGRNGEALRLNESLLQIEPLIGDFSANVQALSMSTGDCSAAELEYRSRISLHVDRDIDHYLRLVCLIGQDADRTAVETQYRRVTASAALLSRELFTELAHAHGDPLAVSAILRGALTPTAPNNRRGAVAQLANAYRDRETTFAALEVMPNPFFMIWRLPPWSGLRTDPRFKDIVRNEGILDYWRTTGNWADACKPIGADDFECH